MDKENVRTRVSSLLAEGKDGGEILSEFIKEGNWQDLDTVRTILQPKGEEQAIPLQELIATEKIEGDLFDDNERRREAPWSYADTGHDGPGNGGLTRDNLNNIAHLFPDAPPEKDGFFHRHYPYIIAALGGFALLSNILLREETQPQPKPIPWNLPELPEIQEPITEESVNLSPEKPEQFFRYDEGRIQFTTIPSLGLSSYAAGLLSKEVETAEDLLSCCSSGKVQDMTDILPLIQELVEQNKGKITQLPLKEDGTIDYSLAALRDGNNFVIQPGVELELKIEEENKSAVEDLGSRIKAIIEAHAQASAPEKALYLALLAHPLQEYKHIPSKSPVQRKELAAELYTQLIHQRKQVSLSSIVSLANAEQSIAISYRSVQEHYICTRRKRVHDMRTAGVSVREIAAREKRSKSTIYRDLRALG